MRFLVAFLFLSSAAFAENLPPVPKAQEIAVRVEAEVAPAPKPSRNCAVPLTEMLKAPKACEPVSEAPASCVPVSEAPKTCGPAQSLENLPPTTCADAVQDFKAQVRTCHYSLGTGVKFVTNEFVRKPVFEVEKSLHQAEARRLERESARLQQSAEKLAARSADLTQKIKATDPTDLQMRLKLVRQEREFATEANNLAVRRAALDLKQAEHAEKCKKIREKDELLYRHAE